MSADESPHHDTQLAAKAVAGDEVALSKLLFSHHERLVAEVGSKLPSDVQGSVSAEDIVQEAYVVAFQRIATFNPEDHERFYPWLAAIARNRLMDAVKAQRAAKRGGGRVAVTGEQTDDEEMVQLLEVLAVHTRTPSRSAADHEAAQAVERALGNLSEDYKEALRLRYLEALPVAQIASRLSRTEGAVHMLCHRGLQAMRLALGDTSKFLTKKS
ncbi:MAG TPA: sigma-70 family RNA polymerase sigma factor [Phycisphaerae bacterium]|nr:sigma-70 family RNA polymerase sigma factor [Phycisphaerae bacterium]